MIETFGHRGAMCNIKVAMDPPFWMPFKNAPVFPVC